MIKAKHIAHEIINGGDYAMDELCCPQIVADQIRMQADEVEGFENQIFEAGLHSVVKAINKQMEKSYKRSVEKYTEISAQEAGYKLGNWRFYCVMDAGVEDKPTNCRYTELVFKGKHKFRNLLIYEDGTLMLSEKY